MIYPPPLGTVTGPKVPWNDDVWAPVGVAAVLVSTHKVIGS